MSYIGCGLFGLFFLVISAQGTGGLHTRMMESLTWLQEWAPFSYLAILILMISGIVSIRTMLTWPKQEEPEDPMAQMRHEAECMAKE